MWLAPQGYVGSFPELLEFSLCNIKRRRQPLEYLPVCYLLSLNGRQELGKCCLE
jgi:hypothetical protein